MTFKEYLIKFFDENEGGWRSFYPGLKPRRLMEEFQYYCGTYYKSAYFASLEGAQASLEILEDFKEKLKKGIPLEYINKRAFFYDGDFYVDSRVLIPRQETEELFAYALAYLEQCPVNSLKIAEIGVGSGALLLTLLAHLSHKEVEAWATDISEEALQVFEINRFRHQFRLSSKHKVNSIKTDRFAGLTTSFDLILSNPPYIKKQGDRATVHKQVSQFEPEVALYLEDTVYAGWFEEFFEKAYDCSTAQGTLLMEGHEAHLKNLQGICEKYWGKGKVQILQDMSGRDRFLKASK